MVFFKNDFVRTHTNAVKSTEYTGKAEEAEKQSGKEKMDQYSRAMRQGNGCARHRFCSPLSFLFSQNQWKPRTRLNQKTISHSDRREKVPIRAKRWDNEQSLAPHLCYNKISRDNAPPIERDSVAQSAMAMGNNGIKTIKDTVCITNDSLSLTNDNTKISNGCQHTPRRDGRSNSS
jgi:hypothetical protein